MAAEISITHFRQCCVCQQVDGKYIAEDLIQDFDAGLEYAEAECILEVQNKGDSRQYLIKYVLTHVLKTRSLSC